MATSNVTSSTTNTTASIDVAGMVAGLMSVENVPLTKLQSQITKQNTKISDLGQLKSKAATFQTALKALENPTSFSSATASSSDASVVTVTSSTGAIAGSHDITVTQLAKPAQYIFNSFLGTDPNLTAVGFNDGTTFTLTVGAPDYPTEHPISVDSSTTIQSLSDSINALGLNIAASVTQTMPGHYALTIQGTQPGSNNNFTFVSDNGSGPDQSNPTVGNQAQDALFTMDGVDYSRSSNTISDALTGLTLNLVSVSSGTTPNPSTITVANNGDNGPAVIKNMISAFNDLASTAKTFTQSASSDGSTPAGPLSGSPGVVSFIDQIKSMLATGVTYNNAGTSSTLGLVQLGVDIQQDGTLQFNAAEYASTSNIATILASGINVGSTEFATRDNNLNAFLTSEVESFGVMDQSITNEQKNLTQLNQKQQDLQIRLNSKQAAYTAQYSSLNALLFTLNQTSNSLTSALAGLTTGQNNR